jgi:hypothetical protein
MRLFSKKEKDADSRGEDGNRTALFGSKRAKDVPATDNPYARNAAASDPYTQAKTQAYGGQPADGGYQAPGRGGYASSNPYGASNDSYGRDSKPAATGNPYGAAPGGYSQKPGYGADRYGAQSGYGGDKYGTAEPPAQPTSRYGSGGYGGLSAADDESRNALFGGASERVQKSQPRADRYGAGPTPYGPAAEQPGGAYSSGGSYGAAGPGPTYQDRKLTAEEEEEEDVRATKQQMRFMKQADVSSTRNALRIAQQAEDSGRDTLARLGVQGDHILNAEMNLDRAHQQNRIAEEHAKELKTLNRSMFAVHVSNPLTASSRHAARDQDVLDKHLDAKADREAVRRLDYEANARMQKTFRDVEGAGQPSGGGGGGGVRGPNLAERAKFQFEADSEDEEMENEIDSNLDALGGAAGRLHMLAKATNQELDAQNRHLDRIGQKVSGTGGGGGSGGWLTRACRVTRSTSGSRRTRRSWIGFGRVVRVGSGGRWGGEARRRARRGLGLLCMYGVFGSFADASIDVHARERKEWNTSHVCMLHGGLTGSFVDRHSLHGPQHAQTPADKPRRHTRRRAKRGKSNFSFARKAGGQDRHAQTATRATAVADASAPRLLVLEGLCFSAANAICPPPS